MSESPKLSEKTFAQRMRCAINHPYEREALGLLYLAGWDRQELAQVFDTSDDTISRTLENEGYIE